MFDLIKFFLFTIIFLYLPGGLLSQWANLKLENLVKFGLSLGLGICAFIYITFWLRLLHLPFVLLYIYGILAIVLTIKQKKLTLRSPSLPRLSRMQVLGLFLGALCTWALAAGHFRSHQNESGLYFAGGRDGLWRLGIISELLHSPNPQVPGFAGELLKNYHYFYDLLLAATQSLTGIAPVWLYSQMYVVLVALLFVLATYTLLGIWVNNLGIRIFGVILTIFTGNLSYVLPYISDKYHFIAKSNIFMSDQPFDQSHNPFNLMAYALFLLSVYLFWQWNIRKTFKTFLLFSLLSGTLVGIKIYAGAILLGGFMLILVFKIWQDRSLVWWWVTPFVLGTSVLLSVKGRQFNLLRFNPGWLLAKMVQDQDRLNLPDMELREQFYLQTGNYLRLTLLKVQQLSYYILGNFNTRIFAFGLILKRFKPKIDLTLVFLLIISALGIIIAIFFSQSRAVYDSIQFSQYGLLGFSILSVIVLARIAQHFSENGWVTLGLVLILFVSVPTNLIVLWEQIHGGTFFISSSELAGLGYLNRKTNPDIRLLNDLSEEKLATDYVPALSNRRSYLSGLSLAEQTGVDTQARLKEVEDFFVYTIDATPRELLQKKEFLERADIEYIYLSQAGIHHQPLMQALNLLPVFSNTEVQIYQVKI